MLFGSCLLWLDCLSHALTYNTFARSFELEERAYCDFTAEQSRTRGVVALFSDFFPWFCLVWKHFGWPMRRSRCIEQSSLQSYSRPLSAPSASSFLQKLRGSRNDLRAVLVCLPLCFKFMYLGRERDSRVPTTRHSRREVLAKFLQKIRDACFYLFLLYWNFISLSCHRNVRIPEDALTLNYERIFRLR